MSGDGLKPAPEDPGRDLRGQIGLLAHYAACVVESLNAWQRRALAAEAERDKLAAFKSWVHAYLDAHGVPHHPSGLNVAMADGSVRWTLYAVDAEAWRVSGGRY